MDHAKQFYINGQWVDPVEPVFIDVTNPATEESIGQIAMGSRADVDLAVAAARAAFPAYSTSSREERLALLERILTVYKERFDDIARVVSMEMGAPIELARTAQAALGAGHWTQIIKSLREYEFEEQRGSTLVIREAIGVCGLITPWNWPINQIVLKVAPALAVGCTVVLKPSEIAPLNAIVLAEILHEAGVPPGVFNLVNGDGMTVGTAMSSHPDIDMMSFTGSTRAGILVAKAAADTVKRVSQELGGKSANILLPDADFGNAVTKGVAAIIRNSGQSCNAPTRMLIPSEKREEVSQIVKEAAATFKIGDPQDQSTSLGPVVSRQQYDKIQDLIKSGIEEGAEVLMGGLGMPEHLNRGYYVRPTVFIGVTPEMRVAREEIFGPVLSIMSYEGEEDAIEIANGTVYGLAAYVQSKDITSARRVASQMRAGTVYINYPAWDTTAPFGGYKQSGNGREYADFGMEEFLEVKGIVGFGTP